MFPQRVLQTLPESFLYGVTIMIVTWNVPNQSLMCRKKKPLPVYSNLYFFRFFFRSLIQMSSLLCLVYITLSTHGSAVIRIVNTQTSSVVRRPTCFVHIWMGMCLLNQNVLLVQSANTIQNEWMNEWMCSFHIVSIQTYSPSFTNYCCPSVIFLPVKVLKHDHFIAYAILQIDTCISRFIHGPRFTVQGFTRNVVSLLRHIRYFTSVYATTHTQYVCDFRWPSTFVRHMEISLSCHVQRPTTLSTPYFTKQTFVTVSPHQYRNRMWTIDIMPRFSLTNIIYIMSLLHTPFVGPFNLIPYSTLHRSSPQFIVPSEQNTYCRKNVRHVSMHF